MSKEEIRSLIANKQISIEKEIEKLNKIKAKIKSLKDFIAQQNKLLEDAEVKDLLSTMKQNNIPTSDIDLMVRAYLAQPIKAGEKKNETHNS